MGVAEQLPIAVFPRHTAVANPDRRYPFPSHSLTSYQIFCRNPAVSPWYRHTCSASNASFYRCCFLWYKLRNGTIPVFSRPSDKSLLFSLLMTSINLEYTRTHHLEGRRRHIYFQRKAKQSSWLGHKPTPAAELWDCGCSGCSTSRTHKKRQKVPNKRYLVLFHLHLVLVYLHFVVHLWLAAVRCLPWVLSLSPDIGTVFNSYYFLSSSCPLPSHPASVIVALRELW